MCQPISWEKRESVALVWMDNPPANLWTIESLQQLKETVNDISLDHTVRALVLCSRQERFFSAGADLQQFSSGNSEIAAEVAKSFSDAFGVLDGFSGVSIAAINGLAVGGGLEVALACDIRIAGESASLGLPEARVGLLPCAGGTQMLANLVGEGWASRIILCGESVSANQALKIGLVEEVVPTEELLARAIKLAKQVERQSPGAVEQCKRLLKKTRSQTAEQIYAAEHEAFVGLFSTEDQQEGVNAFLQKRPAEWKNR